MEDKDDARIWRAINWRGDFEVSHNEEQCPTHQEFKEFFENTLNSQTNLELSDDLRTNMNVPILDEPIMPTQVEQQAKLMKSDKACGLDGVSAGIFKILPVLLILIITSLFNNSFSSGV